MKYLNSSIAVTVAFVMASLLMACDTNQRETQDGYGNGRNDGDNRTNTSVVEAHPEYTQFRKDALETIEENKKKISDLRTRLNKTGGDAPLDNMRANRIENLEERNTELRARLLGYEDAPSDWDKFKREFNSDMQSFEEAFKDLGRENTN